MDIKEIKITPAIAANCLTFLKRATYKGEEYDAFTECIIALKNISDQPELTVVKDKDEEVVTPGK